MAEAGVKQLLQLVIAASWTWYVIGLILLSKGDYGPYFAEGAVICIACIMWSTSAYEDMKNAELKEQWDDELRRRKFGA